MLFEPLSMSGVTEQEYGLYLGPIHYGTLEGLNVELERVQDLGPSILARARPVDCPPTDHDAFADGDAYKKRTKGGLFFGR
jgi:hypothetical protein